MAREINIPTHPHHVRTFFASVFGAVGIWLILTSILVVWLNQTLTNTNTFTSTVAPLITKPAIQNFVRQKVDTQIIQDTNFHELAAALLPASQIAGKTDAELQAIAAPFIDKNVAGVIQSQDFADLFRNTVQSAQKQLVTQLGGSSSKITLDLSPAVSGVISQLKQTELAPLSDQLNVKPGTGILNLSGSSIDKLHIIYKAFKAGTVVVLLLAVAAIGVSVWLSVRHGKTLRRILISVGILSLLTAAALQAPSFITFGTDPVTHAAIAVLVKTLLHNLQIFEIVIGTVCLVSAVISKLVAQYGYGNGYGKKPTTHIAAKN
jgi:hypothetical protein